MSTAAAAFRAVSKEYDGRTVLSDVSLSIASGARVALLGESGCGKSTLLRLLSGLEAPSTGEVLLDGEVASRAGTVLIPPHRRRIAMVFQDLALWPNLSVSDNVSLGLSRKGLSKKAVSDRTREALDFCGIASFADQRPGTLSGGEQQRVALARVVAARPKFLFLDEPFQGLDLVTKTRLLRDIGLMVTQRELTLVVVTHDPLEAEALCTEAIVLAGGRMQEAGPFDELLRAPCSELLRQFARHV